MSYRVSQDPWDPSVFWDPSRVKQVADGILESKIYIGQGRSITVRTLGSINEDGSLKGKTKWHNQTGPRAEKLAKLMANIFVDKD